MRRPWAKGAYLRATEQPIDTGTAAGKAFIDMLGVFAEFETNLRRERQLEGIAKAKEAGVYKGGKPRIDREAVHSLHRDGNGPTEIAKALGISRMHAYRLIALQAQAIREHAAALIKLADAINSLSASLVSTSGQTSTLLDTFELGRVDGLG